MSSSTSGSDFRQSSTPGRTFQELNIVAPSADENSDTNSDSGWRKGLRRRILNFTPSWFSVNMGTGITSSLLHQLPYQFKGLHVIANAIFILNSFLFVLFLVASITRYTRWPTVWKVMLYHPQQSLFLGTFPMGLATIGNMIVYTCVPAFGNSFVKVAWAIWWIDSLISVIICIGVPFTMFTRHHQSFDEISGIWLLPVVTTVVAAASGGVVATVLPPAEARLTVIISYILWGIGVPIAFLIMGLYYARLAIHKVPPAAMIASVFLPVGPCGQGAFGLIQLSSIIREQSLLEGVALGGAALYTPDEARMMGSAIYAGSIVAALVIWGLGLFWFVIALLTVADMRRRKTLPFNMGWWGFTFPIGTFAVATTALAKELDSTAFRVIGTILSLCVTVLWVVIAIRTGVQVWKGSMFFAPCLSPFDGKAPSKSQLSEVPLPQ